MIDKIDIVLQATGGHAHSITAAFVNGLRSAGLLHKAFYPRAAWGANTLIDDDGLAKYLRVPGKIPLLLVGFDWHSQPLHNTEKWRNLWKQCGRRKVMYLHEDVSNYEVLTGKADMSKAFYEASLLVDGIVYTSPTDEIIVNSTGRPNVWLPYGVDESVFYPVNSFSKRKNRAYFRGKTMPFGSEREYSDRRLYLDTLKAENLVDHPPFVQGNISVEQLTAELNEYRIVLGLPSVFSGFPCRITEGMACGCVMVAKRPQSGLEKNLFREGEEIVYFDDERSLIAVVNELIGSPGSAQRIASRGCELVRNKFSMKSQMIEIAKWIATEVPESSGASMNGSRWNHALDGIRMIFSRRR